MAAAVTSVCMRAPNVLDVSRAPPPESTPTFLSLPSEWETVLGRHLPETLARLDGALHLAFLMSQEANAPGGRARAATFFRSALVEFVSVADMAHAESAGRPELQKFYVTGTSHPAPHALWLLRNVQVHLASSRLADSTRSLWLRHVPDAQPVDVDVWLVQDLAVAQLRELRAVNEQHQYTEDQLAELVTWFNTAQALFGVHDVVYRGVEEVARRLVEQVT